MNRQYLLFLTATLFLFSAGITAMTTGCAKKIILVEEQGCPDPVNGGNCSKGLVITICSNHGHFIKEDIMTVGPEGYEIKGSSDHSHTLYINGGYYRDLQMNRGLQLVSSSNNGHTHMVTINCVKE